MREPVSEQVDARIEGQALIASKKHNNKRLAARILTALEARENEDDEQQ